MTDQDRARLAKRIDFWITEVADKYLAEFTKEACDACPECSELVMCQEHSLMSAVREAKELIAVLRQPPVDAERIAQMVAHRGCINEEHDPLNGKISGFCVVCGLPWPCDYAGPKPPAFTPEGRPPTEPSAEQGPPNE